MTKKNYKDFFKSLKEEGEVGPEPINNTTKVFPDKEPVVNKKSRLRYLKRNEPK